MNKQKIAIAMFALISIIGAITIAILFSIAMTLYAQDAQNYSERVLSTFLIPFEVVCLVTLTTSVMLYELVRYNKRKYTSITPSTHIEEVPANIRAFYGEESISQHIEQPVKMR